MRRDTRCRMQDEVEKFLRTWGYDKPDWITELSRVGHIKGFGYTFRPDRRCYPGRGLSPDELFELALKGPAAEIPIGTYDKNRYILYIEEDGDQRSLGWSTRFRLLRERAQAHPVEINRVVAQLLDRLHYIRGRRAELEKEEWDLLDRLGTLVGYKK